MSLKTRKRIKVQWTLNHELGNKKVNKGPGERNSLGIDCFSPSQEMKKRGTVWE